MLKVSNVVQEFKVGFFRKKVTALKSVSLEIPARSIFGFLGPNGAGKTTLIQTIVGNRQPVSGTVTLNGIPTSAIESKRKMGYLPERPYFYQHLTATQFLEHYAILSEVKSAEIPARIQKSLELVRLSNAHDKELRHFSKGMLQRVGIAQAVLHDPEFIVLDEPMSGLDPNGRREIRELIFQLSREGKTIFFSTHVVSDVESICDRVAIINSGRITHEGKISELIDPNTQWVEIGVRRADTKTEEFFAEHEFTRIDETIVVKLPIRSEWNLLMSQWVQKGLQIQFATPRRPSLEELILR